MKKQVGNRSRPKNLVLKTYGYEQWFNKESDCEKELLVHHPCHHKKVTRLHVLLTQVKAGNNSN